MERKRVGFTKFCYLLIVISIVLMAGIIGFYFLDMQKTARERTQAVLRNNAGTESDYLSDMFDGHLASLELLADRMKDVDLSNRSAIASAVETHAGLFDDISLVDVNSLRLYGNCLYPSLKDNEDFQKALGGKSLVATEVTKNYEGYSDICIYVPVEMAGHVEAVLIGSILESDISAYFQNVNHDVDSCACIITSTGTYMGGSRNMTEVLGSIGNNYFSYLKVCDFLDVNKNSESIRNSVNNRQEVSFQYKYNKATYIASCIPMNVNNWYLVYMSAGKKVGLSDSVLSAKCLEMMKILLVNLIIIFILLIYAVGSRYKLITLRDKYKIICRQEGALLFEYRFSPKCFEVIGDYAHIVPGKFHALMGEAVYDVYDYVHEDDRSIRGRLREFFDSSDKVFSAELRVEDYHGKYGWYRLTGTLERDEYGVNYRFIGKITNDTKQISMERNLVERAENDMLTGVLNKKTIEEKVAKLLAEKKSDRYYIVYMIDLDNFKNVNDTLGHIYGDQAISDTGDELKKIFKSNALVGRLGGDEFAVCAVYDAFDEQSLKRYAIQKAEAICAANRRSYTDGASRVAITSSVGIAIAPIDGSNFETIYKRVDSAVYKSKKSGKDRYTFYSGTLWRE